MENVAPARRGLTGGKIAVLVMGGLAVAWFLGLFFGLPYLYTKKMENLIGHDGATVEGQLGTPAQKWTAAEFHCSEAFPCQGKPLGGPVYLYSDAAKNQGWYLYFDGSGRLAKVEGVNLPPDVKR